MNALRCPRFDSCNAPVCPLDPQWPRAQHLKGEPVCGLLSELVKVGGISRLGTRLSSEQLSILVRERPKVEARWGAVRSQLKRAARTGSRIEALAKVRNAANRDAVSGEAGETA